MTLPATSGPRLLSHSEIETAATCFARWDFAYGGRLAGGTLKPKTTAPILTGGRAWGAAAAAWHEAQGTLLPSWAAHRALEASLREDWDREAANGFPIPLGVQSDTLEYLGSVLDHYIATAEPLPNLSRLEGQVVVPLPSRTGRRASNRYAFLAYLDGATMDGEDEWIVEFKLRSSLTPPEIVEKSAQYREYAWAERERVRRTTGRAPVGLILDERLDEAPKPPRWVKARRKGDGIDGRVPSHTKDQLTTADLYLDACAQAGCDPDADTVAALRQRRWHQRIPIIFRPGELDATGLDLVSSARLIQQLDSGELRPVRNAKPANCRSCKFNRICAHPEDQLLVDSLYERTVPKRLRGPLEGR